MTAGLTVGEFSRMTQLSVKTLRHYHQVGLLEPAEVNPDTGYRYYTTGQIPTVQVIRRLRDLQMPVAEVKAVLAAPDTAARNALIATHLTRLETQLAQTHAAVDSLRHLLRPPAGTAPVSLRTHRPAAAAAIRQTVDRADVLAWWQGALGELHATVQAQHLAVTGPSGGLFASELFQQDRGEVTMFIPVTGPVAAIGRVFPLTVPGAELAVITHRGAPADIDLSYGQLGAYVTTSAISVDGPLREYYLVDGHDTPTRPAGGPRSAGRSSAPRRDLPKIRSTNGNGSRPLSACIRPAMSGLTRFPRYQMFSKRPGSHFSRAKYLRAHPISSA